MNNFEEPREEHGEEAAVTQEDIEAGKKMLESLIEGRRLRFPEQNGETTEEASPEEHKEAAK